MIKLKSYLFFSVIILVSVACQNNYQLKNIKAKNIPIDSTLAKQDSIESIIEPYRNGLQAEMNKLLSYTEKAMFKSDNPLNTAIGNMMADAVLEMANPVFVKRNKDSIDAVLLNYGGIRSGISKGVITTKTAYNIMPFENMVVIAELDAETMRALIDYLAKNQVAHPIANMNLIIDNQGKIQNVNINGKPIDENQTYLIATSDYLIQGGDNMNFFKKAHNVYDIDYKLRNLFIDYFAKHDTINPQADNRFIKIP